MVSNFEVAPGIRQSGFVAAIRKRTSMSRAPVTTAFVVALTACALLGVASISVLGRSPVFREWAEAVSSGSAATGNLYGMLCAAAGRPESARSYFEAAKDASPLANENLAGIAIEEKRFDEALAYMKTATRQQNARLAGATPEQRASIRPTLADYANTRAVIAHELGRSFDAVREARAARTLDNTMVEARYNLGVLMLEHGSTQRPGRARTAHIRRAEKSLRKTLALDPDFHEARAMLGVAQALAGDCAKGGAAIREALASGGKRALSVPGWNALALPRRRRIETPNPELDPAARLAACEAAAPLALREPAVEMACVQPARRLP